LFLFHSNRHVKFPAHFVPVGAMTTELRACCLVFSAQGSKQTAGPGTGLYSERKKWNLPLGSQSGEDAQVNCHKTTREKCKKIKGSLFLGTISIVTTLDSSNTGTQSLNIN
jgi:hypothetical protein